MSASKIAKVDFRYTIELRKVAFSVNACNQRSLIRDFANGPDRVAFAACFGRAPSNMPGCSFVMPKS